MQKVEYAPDWLIERVGSGTHIEIVLITKVLWGIWFFRNKKIWENKVVSHVIVMDWSSKFFSDQKQAKAQRNNLQKSNVEHVVCHSHRWVPPPSGWLKLNVDAAVRSGSDNFSIGMVFRDHLRAFVAGKAARFVEAGGVFEAQVTTIAEGLNWLLSMNHK